LYLFEKLDFKLFFTHQDGSPLQQRCVVRFLLLPIFIDQKHPTWRRHPPISIRHHLISSSSDVLFALIFGHSITTVVENRRLSKRRQNMKMIQGILLMAMILAPTLSIGHENHREESRPYDQWWSYNNTQRHYSDNYFDDDRYDRRQPQYKPSKKQCNKHNRKNREMAKPGWNVDSRIAKRSPNCRRYTLSARGGKGSARITSIPGKNYIQVTGQKSGYVCFQGEPTLELGKLGNPNIKVTFKLEGKGSYGFGRGKTGSRYKNNWYRSYWGL